MGNTFEGTEYLTVNTLGHAAGVLTFGIFLALALWRRPAERVRASGLAILAAALAFLWNLASFLVLVIAAESQAEQITAAAGFCVLSLLPAVLLHLCLSERFPVIVRCGYVLSTGAITAHLLELATGAERYHRAGLAVITIGFGLLTVVSVVKALWSQDDNPRVLGSRIFATMSLFLLAISFVHFSEGQSQHAWSTELAFHHAGIPLALFILLQDYRFVLLDAFIRFLANGLLAALFAVVIAISAPHLSFVALVLVAGLVLGLFAVTRTSSQKVLSRIVFGQPDADHIIRELRSLTALVGNEEIFLREAAQRIAAFMQTTVLDGYPTESLRSVDLAFPTLAVELPESRELHRHGVEIIVPIRSAHATSRYLLLGERRGGRRYLSEDLAILSRLAACIAEATEQLRETEMQRLMSQAELRALQSQIHPHFLFNALNTLYGIIPREVTGARRMLLNLADILRYFLQSDKAFIALEEELRIVRAYLSIEELRLGEKLRIALNVDETALREFIPVLSIQPLVENAVKHGVAVRPDGGAIRVEVKKQGDGLRILVHDTGPGFSPLRPPDRQHAGIGLENVSRRLRLCYGPAARVEVKRTAEGTTVSFLAPCEPTAATMFS
jgi:two-component system, LytTR family, sensor kinase